MVHHCSDSFLLIIGFSILLLYEFGKRKFSIGLKIGLKCKKWTLDNDENPVISMVRLAGIEPAHPVPETGALSPEL